jgi:4-hydroxy-tetrahydrodipicolinate reductase
MKKSVQRIRLGLNGASGKMGRKIAEIVEIDPIFSAKFELVFAASGPQDPRFQTFNQQKCDVLVDFSAPKATLEVADLCSQNKVPLLVGTTGFTQEQLGKLKKRLASTPWVLAPNTSFGVFLMKKAFEAIAPYVSAADLSVGIFEIHHKNKKDAPSGTALSLRDTFHKASQSDHPVQMASFRGGTEVGFHEIHLLGESESLQLLHRAQERSLFAFGALRIAEALTRLKSKGSPYSAEEIFEKNLLKK